MKVDRELFKSVDDAADETEGLYICAPTTEDEAAFREHARKRLLKKKIEEKKKELGLS